MLQGRGRRVRIEEASGMAERTSERGRWVARSGDKVHGLQPEEAGPL